MTFCLRKNKVILLEANLALHFLENHSKDMEKVPADLEYP